MRSAKFQFEVVGHAIGFLRVTLMPRTTKAARESNPLYYPQQRVVVVVGFKSNCPLVGPGPIEDVPSVGGLPCRKVG